jgi:hypothetical protein
MPWPDLSADGSNGPEPLTGDERAASVRKMRIPRARVLATGRRDIIGGRDGQGDLGAAAGTPRRTRGAASSRAARRCPPSQWLDLRRPRLARDATGGRYTFVAGGPAIDLPCLPAGDRCVDRLRARTTGRRRTSPRTPAPDRGSQSRRGYGFVDAGRGSCYDHRKNLSRFLFLQETMVMPTARTLRRFC